LFWLEILFLKDENTLSCPTIEYLRCVYFTCLFIFIFSLFP
jgi:hypothetical protein